MNTYSDGHPLYPRVRTASEVCAMKRKARNSFLPSSCVGLRTFLVMKDMNVSRSGRARLVTNRILAVSEWMTLASDGSRGGVLLWIGKGSPWQGSSGVPQADRLRR